MNINDLIVAADDRVWGLGNDLPDYRYRYSAHDPHKGPFRCVIWVRRLSSWLKTRRTATVR